MTTTKRAPKVNLDFDLLRGPILVTWNAIAGDLAATCAESGQRLTNESAVECCIDADRLTFFARGADERAAAEAAEQELSRAIGAHGYPRVLRALARRFSLV
jgi:hypothetical protein